MSENTKYKQVENQLMMQEITRMFNTLGKESVTFTVRGYSMRPFLEDRRDKVILTPPRTPDIGDIVLARTDKGVYALHRVIRKENGVYTMQGDGNPISQKEHFTDTDIIGIAQAFIRKGKTYETSGRVWRSYSTIWHILKPFRRALLAIYRRI
ncbi:MAG: S24/S26 family peptidase [Bacteroidaceae bacterium]|nr:S24/S26 family peptidase [Bacteroidaceae bacterium]